MMVDNIPGLSIVLFNAIDLDKNKNHLCNKEIEFQILITVNNYY